jgi:hypothetical protein
MTSAARSFDGPALSPVAWRCVKGPGNSPQGPDVNAVDSASPPCDAADASQIKRVCTTMPPTRRPGAENIIEIEGQNGPDEDLRRYTGVLVEYRRWNRRGSLNRCRSPRRPPVPPSIQLVERQVVLSIDTSADIAEEAVDQPVQHSFVGAPWRSHVSTPPSKAFLPRFP